MRNLLQWLGVVDDPGTRHAGGLVIARAYPRERYLRRLAAEGVRVVINLHPRGHAPSLLSSLRLEQVHLPVQDFAAPTLDQLRQGVHSIKTANGLVLVHCGGGYGRTGTLLACLYVDEGLTPDEAIARVRAERPGAIETVVQVAAVRKFAEHKPPNKTPEPTTTAVTSRAPSSTSRAGCGRGSS